jgi:hypothetical protein
LLHVPILLLHASLLLFELVIAFVLIDLLLVSEVVGRVGVASVEAIVSAGGVGVSGA